MLYNKKKKSCLTLISSNSNAKLLTKHVRKANQNLAILRKVAFQGIEKSPVSYAS